MIPPPAYPGRSISHGGCTSWTPTQDLRNRPYGPETGEGIIPLPVCQPKADQMAVREQLTNSTKGRSGFAGAERGNIAEVTVTECRYCSLDTLDNHLIPM